MQESTKVLPVQSITDEIMGLVNRHAHPDAINATLRTRLLAIESELEELRKGKLCDDCGLPMALIDNPYGQPGKFWNCYNPECYTTPVKYRTVEQPSGLPCSSELGDETGG